MSIESVCCPALFIAASASGQGKTTITAALARYFTNLGKRVTVFKTGPDYLDPQILSVASRQPVEQLDIWMAGEAYCRQRLFEAAQVSDLILIEGVMGMYDGTPSSADLAALFGIPVAIVMDVGGMAQTAAALAVGLASYRPDVSVAGLIANRCGSDYHAGLIRDALPDTLPMLAALKRDAEVTLPERHLGLVQAIEIQDEIDAKLELAAQWLVQSGNERLLSLPEEVVFTGERPPEETLNTPLAGKVIAVAKDNAFSFIYAANIALLETLGADIIYFSPLRDQSIPMEVDAVWLPGGYPEIYAEALSENTSLKASFQQFFEQDKTILAECGGMLYCTEALSLLSGEEYPMLGLLQGNGVMRDRGGCQGMQTAMLPEGEIRAHSHHRSATHNTPEPIAYGKRQKHPAPGEAIYRVKGLTASYLHLFFPANPAAIASLFGR